MSDPHEGCARCFHSVKAHGTEGSRPCENEGCDCVGLVGRPPGEEFLPRPPRRGARPATLTPLEHDDVEALAESIFLRSVTPHVDFGETAAFARSAAEAFVRARPARPASPRLTSSVVKEGLALTRVGQTP